MKKSTAITASKKFEQKLKTKIAEIRTETGMRGQNLATSSVYSEVFKKIHIATILRYTRLSLTQAEYRLQMKINPSPFFPTSNAYDALMSSDDIATDSSFIDTENESEYDFSQGEGLIDFVFNGSFVIDFYIFSSLLLINESTKFKDFCFKNRGHR